MNHPTISAAIEASAQSNKFAFLILPADRVPGVDGVFRPAEVEELLGVLENIRKRAVA